MKKINITSTVPASILLVFLIVLSAPLFADQPQVEEITPIDFDTVGSDHYNIRTNTFEQLTASGKLELTFQGSATLRTRLVDSGGLDSDQLEIRLQDEENWRPLKTEWLELGSFSNSGEKVTYEMRFSPDQSTEPGTYPVGLEFSLSQTGGCYNPVVEVSSGKLGPDKNPTLKLISDCGPVRGGKVSGDREGTTNATGRFTLAPKLPDDVVDVNIVTVGKDLDSLDGDFDFGFSGSYDEDLKIFVSGALGPGERVELTVLDGTHPHGEPVEGADISGSFEDETDSDGKFSFTFPEEDKVEINLDIEHGDENRKANLQFKYKFKKEDDAD